MTINFALSEPIDEQFRCRPNFSSDSTLNCSLLNGQGELYWDGIGDSGVPKPFFMVISVQDSIFRNINLLNCPHHCTILEGSDGVTLTNWNIDCSYGEGHGGKNTDGFDIISANNVVIKDSSVVNQDDCVAVNQGFNMSFSGLYCNGTHGISLSVGFSQLSYTHTNGGPGEITDITYENIRFSDVHKYGVNIQEDYANGRGTGIAKANIPIRNLVFRDIQGTLTEGSGKTMPVYIFCADGGCANWSWSDVSIGEGGPFQLV
ncbi:hypothetical protein NQ317_003773 [Molorchus minor]|uniref:Endo-polygalacturonase n=1 Tax=Molorchus minor TaxID=1323400 RepID=A0ABQ9J0H9_9CUCU|nr:hypothetical protein NQ317_003773 [Molorchus minor]